MSKYYRNYNSPGVASTPGQTVYDVLKSLGGVFNFFDLSLDGGSVRASGGTELSPGDGYKYHVFTSPGTFFVLSGGLIEYLVIGGGGSGGSHYGGGGGAQTESGSLAGNGGSGIVVIRYFV